MPLDTAERLYLDRQVTLARAIFVALALVDLIEISVAGSRTAAAIFLAVYLLLALAVSSVRIAGFIIEYNWWKEVGQVGTWISMLGYSIAPALIAAFSLTTLLGTAPAHAAAQPVQVLAVGGTIACTATLADGSKVAPVVRVVDEAGHLSIENAQ